MKNKVAGIASAAVVAAAIPAGPGRPAEGSEHRRLCRDHRQCRRGERCAIPGLGSFSVAERKAREGRNPRTKETIAIPASKNVRFKAGKDLRDLLNVKKGKR